MHPDAFSQKGGFYSKCVFLCSGVYIFRVHQEVPYVVLIDAFGRGVIYAEGYKIVFAKTGRLQEYSKEFVIV